MEPTLWPTGSVVPLKVIGENGITVVAAGEQFDKKDGKMLPASPSSWVKDLIELDELQAATADPVREGTLPETVSAIQQISL